MTDYYRALESIFTSENKYTVLQLIKALIDTTNELAGHTVIDAEIFQSEAIEGQPVTITLKLNYDDDSSQNLQFVVPSGIRGIQGYQGKSVTAVNVSVSETADTYTTYNLSFTVTDPATGGSTSSMVGQFNSYKGDAATVEVGSVTTLEPSSDATVVNSGTSAAAVLDFGIPKGAKGDGATVSIGTVTTLPAGSSATVTNSGTSTDSILNFGIPKGDKGDTGPQGETGTIYCHNIRIQFTNPSTSTAAGIIIFQIYNNVSTSLITSSMNISERLLALKPYLKNVASYQVYSDNGHPVNGYIEYGSASGNNRYLYPSLGSGLTFNSSTGRGFQCSCLSSYQGNIGNTSTAITLQYDSNDPTKAVISGLNVPDITYLQQLTFNISDSVVS